MREARATRRHPTAGSNSATEQRGRTQKESYPATSPFRPRRTRIAACGSRRSRPYTVPPRWLFLRIETDDGTVGWGEPIVEGRAATVAAAVDELADYLLDRDPRAIEDIWTVLYRGGFYRGGSIHMSALAGIDQALWDIKGKHYGAPVFDLLGGAVRDRIKVYSWIGGDRPSETASGGSRRGRPRVRRRQDERHVGAAVHRLLGQGRPLRRRASPPSATRWGRTSAWASTSTAGSTSRWRRSSSRSSSPTG